MLIDNFLNFAILGNMSFPDKNYLIQLTNAVYRLTLLFPKKEPLRYKMREIANEILVSPKDKDLEALDSMFEVALLQNWVKASDILVIKEEYAKISIKPDKVDERLPENTIFTNTTPDKQENGEKVEETVIPQVTNSNRQEEIIRFIKDNGKAQVWQIKEIFPDISKRTLRRDFESMLGQGLIERMGENNDTFYKIKTN